MIGPTMGSYGISAAGHYSNSSHLGQAWWGNSLQLRAKKQSPSSRSPIGLLLHRDEPKAEDLLEVEPLVCRVWVMWCKVVFCALVTVRPES